MPRNGHGSSLDARIGGVRGWTNTGEAGHIQGSNYAGHLAIGHARDRGADRRRRTAGATVRAAFHGVAFS